MILSKSFADALARASAPALFRDGNEIGDEARARIKERHFASIMAAGGYISEEPAPAEAVTPPAVGATVTITGFDPGCLLADGTYKVSAVFDTGGFCVEGSQIIVWPARILSSEG